TPIINFIQEYLVGNVRASVLNDASRATDVDLTLLLNGPLTKPEINFDLSFPDLSPELANYANSKRRLLLLDQNELNRQAFGLIVVGQFLPADLSFSTQDVAINTLSEWASNYFSLLLNNLLTDAFGEDTFISTFNFGVTYNRYNTEDVTQDIETRGDVFEFTIQKTLGNKWNFVGDINVLSEDQLAINRNSRTFVGNDFALEALINDKRTLKFRIYQRLQPDIIGGSRLQVGTGLSWRKEFNSLRDLFRDLSKEAGRQ
ncbi:MAG: translocation/assembly module TamB domain-containing protein, partial [Bacteroidota bacterium]